MKTLLELYQQSTINESAHLLSESTYELDADVDFIYTESRLEEYIHNVKTNPSKNVGRPFKELDSSMLTCPKSIEAHKLNPVKIESGIFGTSSWYNPSKRMIRISPNRQAIDMIGANEKPDEYDNIQMFDNELTDERIKATIHHELSHWISDSIHNQHLSRIVSHAADEGGHYEDVLLGKYNVGETYYEIDAQIHGIKQIKRKYTSEEWDRATLQWLFYKYPALNNIKNPLIRSPNDNEVYDWIRTLTTRMSREGLLGKNMTKFPSY